MLVKRRGDKICIHGVRHGNSHDTSYVTAEIRSGNYNASFVEKDPNTPLNEYGLQIRKIIGYLREKNTDVIEFDDRLDKHFYENKTPEGFDAVEQSDTVSKEDRIRQMRRRVNKNYPNVRRKIFLERERRMIQVVRRWIEENGLGKILIVVGESHVPPIYDCLNNKI